jgi:hypothetical protein
VTIIQTKALRLPHLRRPDPTLEVAIRALFEIESAFSLVVNTDIVIGQFLLAPVTGQGVPVWRDITAADLAKAINIGGQAVDGWYIESVQANQTNQILERLKGALPLGVSNPVTDNPSGWIALRAGSVTGIAVHSNTARTAGTLTLKVFKNGVQLGTLSAVLDGTNTSFKATTQAKNLDAYVAGDILDLRMTTDANWAPILGGIRGMLEIQT